MSNATVPIDIKLTVINNPGDDDRDIAEITQRLFNEIERLGIENVQHIKEENISDKTKTGGAEILGELLLTLAGSGGIAVSLIGLVKSWITREGHNVKFTRKYNDGTIEEIEVTGSTTDQVNRLISMFKKR
jgi:hypothetical protein